MPFFKKSANIVLGSLFLSTTAFAGNLPLPFDTFSSHNESFGCKSLSIPGANLLPHSPHIIAATPLGWSSLTLKNNTRNASVESLIIKGSLPVFKKTSKKKTAKGIMIPAGGLVYDASLKEKHLPIHETGLLFGQAATLLHKTVVQETCRNFSVLLGRQYNVGDSLLTYKKMTPHDPLIQWRSLDGVSIRPGAVGVYREGHFPQKTETLINGVYTHAGQLVDFRFFSAPLISSETWNIAGRTTRLTSGEQIFPGFHAVPISCPIGHHIGLMVYNTHPIFLQIGHPLSFFKGYLTLKVDHMDETGKNIVYEVNGQTMTGTFGIDTMMGQSRATEGVLHSMYLSTEK